MQHRWGARGLVVALHLGLLAALWTLRSPRPDAPREQRLAVRLIPPRPPTPAAPAPQAPRRQTPATPRTAAPAPAAVDVPVEAPMPAPAAVAPQAQPPEEPPRMTLRLTLPPGYAASANARRNPALDDPRSNTPKPTPEDRIADATGGAGAWVEEPVENHSQAIGALGDRRTVMRRGNTCIEVFRSRIADSDPFNGSVAPRTVPMMGKPYTCKGPGR